MLYTQKNPTTLAEIRASYRVPTLDELRERVSAEGVGNRWKPLHHADLIDSITNAAEDRGFTVADSSFTLSKDTHDVFGYMQFDGYNLGRSDMAPVLGFRSSNMQRFGLLGVSGSKVFICSNGMIAGEFVFGMKHTKGRVAGLDVGISEGLDKWESQSSRLAALVAAMESTPLSRSESDHMLMEAVRDKAVSITKIPKIDEVYQAFQSESHPHHSAFGERNAWSLYNAATEAAKVYSVRVGETALKGFPRTIARIGGFSDLLDAPVTETDTVSLN